MTEKAIAKQNPVMGIATFQDIFGDIDFKTLNASIEAMAGKSTGMKEEEKKGAVAIITDWEHNVVQRLKERATEMEHFLGYFDPERRGYHFENPMSLEQEAELAEKTGTKELFEAFRTATEEYQDLKHDKPDELEEDLDKTVEESILERKDKELESLKYNLKLKKADRKKDKAQIMWIRALNKTDEVKDIIDRARKYRRNLSRFISECSSKSQVAKLNVTVDDADVRKAIQDLLDFQIKI